MKKHKRFLSIFLALCMLISMFPAVLAAGEIFYVSADGSDANPGSAAEPFASIAAAYGAISGSGTIRILGDLDIENNVTCGQNKAVTILGDGGNAVTYTGYININSHTDGLFTVTAGSVTFENITVKLPDTRGTNGRLLYVGSGATATLGNGAIISHSYLAYSGGGVMVDGGTFTMLPGSTVRDCYVGNNTTAMGGGVFVQAGTFHMQGGEISNNIIHTSGSYPGYGAGVAVGAGAEVRMSGGVITGNTADAAGGGVYVEQGGTFYLCGTASVTGNTIRSGDENNVYLPQGVAISVTGALSGVVGLTSGAPDYDVVVGTPSGYTIKVADESRLYYDSGAYDIRLKNSNLVLYHFVSDVEYALENLTSSNMAEETPLGRDYETTLTPQDEYSLPGEIAVFVDGSRLDTDGYSYDNVTGEVVIFGDYVTGDITIEAYGNKQYTMTVKATNALTDLAATNFIVYNETVTVINVSAAPRYACPNNVTVTGSCNYTYTDGVLTIRNATSNISVTIVGEEVPHTIHLDPSEGAVSPTQKTINESQALLGALPIPTRTGYTFTGWFTASGTRVTATTENHMTEDLTLTARWSADTNIRYVIQHFTEYVDSGTNPSYTGQGLHFMSYGGKTKQYYLHDEKVYTDGTADGTRTIADMLMGDFSPLSTDGFIPSGANAYSVTMAADGSSVFPFYYDRNNIKVSFDANGGTLVGGANVDVTYGSIYGLLPNATRAGYNFTGWFTSPTGGEQIQAGDVCAIAASHTLYAHWQASGSTAYKVVHMSQNLDDNIVGYEKTSDNYTVLQTDTLYGTSGMIAYVYAMSITGFAPSSENVYETGIMADGSTVHYLYYDRAITDVSYHPNGGTAVTSGSRLYYGGTFVSFPSAPTRVGYTFAGWYAGIGEESRQVTAGTAISAINPAAAPNFTLYAHWTARTYSLVFQAHGGVGADSKPVTYDKAIGTLPAPVKTGYLFQGWFLDDTLLGAPVGASITEYTIVTTDTIVSVDGNGAESIKTLNAWYLPIEVTITFDVAGGDAIADNTRTAVYDARFETMEDGLPIPTKTGYTFMGWFFAGGTKLEGAASSALLVDVTVQARWMANVYKVTLDAAGGEAPDYIAVTYDGAYTLPTPTRTGYVFDGWFTAQVGGSEVVTGDLVTITAQQILYARWTPLTFTVTFDPQGGELVGDDTITVSYGSRYGTLPSAKRSGYTFDGWFTTPERDGEKMTAETVVAILENTMLYARWTQDRNTGGGGGSGGGSSGGGGGTGGNGVGGGGVVPPPTDSGTLFTDSHIAYIVGRGGGKVQPLAEITRAEIAVIFYRLLSDDVRETYTTTQNSFADVEEGMWHHEAVSTLAAMGILKGYDSGCFGPDNPITRAQLAAIVSRFGDAAATGTVHFVDTTGHWAHAEINLAADKGLMLGDGTGYFRPDSFLTRAEAIACINRLLGRALAGHHALLPGMVTWADNANPNAWYYLDIQEATHGHTHFLDDDGLEIWDSLVR